MILNFNSGNQGSKGASRAQDIASRTLPFLFIGYCNHFIYKYNYLLYLYFLLLFIYIYFYLFIYYLYFKPLGMMASLQFHKYQHHLCFQNVKS